MKILIVTPYFYPMIGGLESYVLHVATELAKFKQCEVVILTTAIGKNTDSIDQVQGLKTYRLKYSFKLSNTPVGFDWLYKINSIISEEKPDVVFAQTPVPFIADVSSFICSLKKIPFTLTYHAGGLKKNQKVADFIVTLYANTFEKLMLHNAKKLICLNEFVRSTTLKNYKNKAELILPGITLPQVETVSRKTTTYSKRILFVGKLDKSHAWKGLEHLLQAFSEVSKMLPDVILDVVGDGDNIQFYKNLSKKLTIENKVTFRGSKTSSQVVEYYQVADMLVLPSTSSAESLGFVILEAMSFGLPVIGSRIGGIQFVIQDKVNGFLVEPAHSQEIAKSIITLYQDEKLYKKFSASSLELSKKYNWKDHTRTLMSIFEKLHLEKV